MLKSPFFTPRAVHGLNMVIEQPTKYSTPYGGKLVYKLPGGNVMNVHLKDNVKTLAGKRWSQVRY